MKKISKSNKDVLRSTIEEQIKEVTNCVSLSFLDDLADRAEEEREATEK